MHRLERRLAATWRRLRPAFDERRLAGLSPRLRTLVIGLLAVSLATMVLFAVVALGPTANLVSATPIARLAVNVVALTGLALGLAVYGATRTPSSSSSPGSRRVRRATDGLLSLAALAIPLTLVTIDAPSATGLATGPTAVIRSLLWLALAGSLLLLLDPRPPAAMTVDRGVDVRRMAVLVLPTGLVLAVVAMTLVIGRSAAPALAMTAPASAVAGFAAVVIVPANLIGQAVDGIAADRARGVAISALTGRRPWLAPAILAGKLALIAVLCVAIPTGPDGAAPLGSSVRIWLGSFLVGAIVLGLLTIERRLGLSIDDSPKVARLVMRVVAAPLAATAILAWLVGVLPAVERHLGVLVGLGLLAAAVLLLLRRGAHLAPWVRVALLLPLAGALSWFTALEVDGLPTALPGSQLVTVVTASIALLIGLVSGLVVVVTWAWVTRQRRLLLYFVAVGIWIVIRVGLDLLAPGTTPLNIDLALTLCLLLAAISWMAGRQPWVDGFEVVVTAVVLLALIELPMALDALPAAAERILVTIAFLLPGLAGIWRDLRDLRGDAGGRKAFRGLAVTCLGYATLAGLVWLVGSSGGNAIESANELVADYLAVPIALLFVAAASADRARPVTGRPQLTKPD